MTVLKLVQRARLGSVVPLASQGRSVHPLGKIFLFGQGQISLAGIGAHDVLRQLRISGGLVDREEVAGHQPIARLKEKMIE